MPHELLWVIVETLKYPAYFAWVLYCLLLVIGLLGFFGRTNRGDIRAKNVEIALVTIASRSVSSSLFEAIRHTRTNFPEIPFYLIVEYNAELLSELKDLVSSQESVLSEGIQRKDSAALLPYSNSGIELVIIPPEYRLDLLGKGRAINFFIDNYVNRSKWYTFIDDDNLLLDDLFLYEISYFESKGYVVCNPVLVTRKGKSALAHLMDNIRIFDDVSIFRLFTGMSQVPLLGLHGEGLTVKGEALIEIGFARKTITEDFSFGNQIAKHHKINKKAYRSWQSSSKVSIRSANSLHDLLRQRGRWFKGIALDLRESPPEVKIVTGTRMILWVFSIFGSWTLSPLWIFWVNSQYWVFLFFIGGIGPFIIFGVLIMKNHANQQWYYIFLVPLYGILEALTPWFVLLKMRKNNAFVVIDKN